MNNLLEQLIRSLKCVWSPAFLAPGFGWRHRFALRKLRSAREFVSRMALNDNDLVMRPLPARLSFGEERDITRTSKLGKVEFVMDELSR